MLNPIFTFPNFSNKYLLLISCIQRKQMVQIRKQMMQKLVVNKMVSDSTHISQGMDLACGYILDVNNEYDTVNGCDTILNNKSVQFGNQYTFIGLKFCFMHKFSIYKYQAEKFDIHTLSHFCYKYDEQLVDSCDVLC